MTFDQPDDDRPRITVIVPAFDAEGTLGACIAALADQDCGAGLFDLVVVDDGSRDGTVRTAREGFGRFANAPWSDARLVEEPHRGVAAARNAGAAVASGDILAFTDADCRPETDWLSRLTAPLSDPTVDATMGRFKSDQRALVARITQGEYAEKERGMLLRRRIAFFDTATGAIRRSVFEAVGGFRDSLLAVEDTDLAFRLAAAGHRIVMVPDAFVSHRHAETWRHYAHRKARIGRWGAWVYATYPSRFTDDTRTPGAMRLQMALVPAILGLSVLTVTGRTPAWVPAGLALVFVASTIGQIRRALEDNLGISAAIFAPIAAAVRAGALDAGLAFGLAELLFRRRGREIVAQRIARRQAASR